MPETGLIEVVRDGSDSLARFAEPCAAVLGPELTAYVAGADSVAEFDAWLDGTDDVARSRAVVRLAAAFEVIRIFAAANLVSLARPWLREVNRPGEQPPARSIRAAREEDGTIKDVLQAAAGWISEGRLARPTPA